MREVFRHCTACGEQLVRSGEYTVIMLRRTSQAVAKTAARAAATQCQAARGVFRVQRAGFASIYDLQTPYEVRDSSASQYDNFEQVI